MGDQVARKSDVVDLAIVILNYRTPDLTIACLESLRGEMRPGIHVVVVDNASPDGSADRIADHVARASMDEWATVLRSPVNGGFAAGNNLGIRSVSANAYVLLNSDTIVRPGALDGLRDALARHPRAGMIGPSFENVAGKPEVSCFRFPHPVGEFVRSAATGPITKLLRRYEVAVPFVDESLEPDWIGFACVVVRRQVIDEVGLLDDGYFMYFEDVDYCRKVRQAGWSILYWPAPRVVHLMGASSNISSEDTTRRRPARYFYEARARYFARQFGVKGLLAANALWTAGRAISFAREVVGRKPSGVRDREILDIWTNALDPLRPSTKAVVEAAKAARAARVASATAKNEADAETDTTNSADNPADNLADNPAGRPVGNPADMGFFELLSEDFATHDRDPLAAGFWAIAVHRFGVWQNHVAGPLARVPLGMIHRSLAMGVDWLWGIELPTDVRVGRRVRIWHHGGMVLHARAIGNDAQIRHNTTFGDSAGLRGAERPVIQDRVDIGVGVSIMGNVTIGHDSVVGPNAVVLASCAPGSTLRGVPARAVAAEVVSPKFAGAVAPAPTAEPG